MPTVISTSTSATATQAFNQRKIDRNQDGTLWEFANDAAASVTPSYSKDNGTTWTATTALPGLTNASLFIDLDDYAHVVWNQSGTAGPNGTTLQSNIVNYYMRGTPNAGRTAWTWSAPNLLSGAAGANYPDVVAHREGVGWHAQVVYSLPADSNTKASYVSVSITSAGVITVRSVVALASVYGNGEHSFPSIDFNHNGDGKTVAGGTPHLYVGWTGGTPSVGVRFRKAVYAAGAWTWNAERAIDSTYYFDPNFCAQSFFDGTRVVFAGGARPSSGNAVSIAHERDAADTTTLIRYLTNSLPYGSSTTYDALGNLYFFGTDNSPAVPSSLGFFKWTRLTATQSAPVTIDPSVGGGAGKGAFASAKRGYSANSLDLVWTDGTASPYNVTFERIALPPLTPYVPAIML